MQPFDPDFVALTDDQLSAIDARCSQYESQRTQGMAVSIEGFLLDSPAEIQMLLRSELLQIEMEILDSWDQLPSPKGLIERFPDLEIPIRQKWEVLQARKNESLAELPHPDTSGNTISSGSTHDDGLGRHEAGESWEERPLLEDPSPRFQILKNLAQGGIGNLFIALDHDLQRHVAIKELKRKYANDRAIVKRFLAEATVTGNLEHPNIVPIYATGRRSDGRPFYAMRWIQGQSMQQAIAELHRQHGPKLDFRTNGAARDLLLRFVVVCRAIGFAHSRGILHRDLKPSNIMVGDFGETLVVDWGLARNLRPTEPKQPTASPPTGSSPTASEPNHADQTVYGTIVGTPGYMSPEQALGHNEAISTASDIYSLGASLFHILTNSVPLVHTGRLVSPHSQPNASSGVAPSGVAPSPHESKVVLSKETETGSPIRLSQFGSFPPPLTVICHKAMQWEPHARYARAELLAADLEAWLMDEPISVLVDTRREKARRWAKAHPAMIAGSLATLLIGFLAMGITLSLLASKNETLRKSNLREQASAREATQNAAIAKANGEEAVHQRQRVLGILNTLLVDVERGLANVPGAVAIQRNVLTSVLNKLGEVAKEFAEDGQVNQSNAMALVDLGDLFARVGTKEIRLEVPRWNAASLSPLEAAEKMYEEAMQIALQSSPRDGPESRRMIAVIQLKQADILRQTARTPEAIRLLKDSLATRRTLLSENPESLEAAKAVIKALDSQGQIELQDRNLTLASAAFDEMESMLEQLAPKHPQDEEIQRNLGIVYSIIGDISVQNGELDRAELLYQKDLAIATALHRKHPLDLTTKRDLCLSLDRIGNMAAQRGHPEKAMEFYLQSRHEREQLHLAEPLDQRSTRELFVSYMKGGDTRMLLNDVEPALADYQKALTLADELANFDPRDATAKRFQSLSAEVLADVAIQQSRLDDALRYAKKSLAISQALAEQDPTNGQMQRDLYIGYAKVAKVLLGQKEFDECLAQLNLAMDIVKTDYLRQPESLQTIRDYSFLLLRFAETHLQAGNASLAANDCQTVLQMLDATPESNRQDAISRRRYANATTMFGQARLAEGKMAEARSAFERSRQLTLGMIEESVRVEQMQQDLKEIESLLASLGDEE